MSDNEIDILRAELLEKGVTAPQSWKTPRLKKELAKFESADPEQEAPTEQASPEAKEDIAQVEPEVVEPEQAAPEVSINKAEAKVKIKAKVQFTNKSLGLKDIEIGQELSVTSEKAKFLVVIDRTCEYING